MFSVKLRQFSGNQIDYLAASCDMDSLCLCRTVDKIMDDSVFGNTSCICNLGIINYRIRLDIFRFQNYSAVSDVFCQKLFRIFQKNLILGKNDSVVTHLTDDQFFPFHTTVALHQDFIS